MSNSRQHRLVLANESETRYQSLFHALYDEWSPAGETEMIWFQALVASAWRLRRVLDMEGAVLDSEMFRLKKSFDQSFQPADAAMRQADALARVAAENPRLLDFFDNAERRLTRSIERAQCNLILLQTQRLGYTPVRNIKPQFVEIDPGAGGQNVTSEPEPELIPPTYEEPERFAYFSIYTAAEERPNFKPGRRTPPGDRKNGDLAA